MEDAPLILQLPEPARLNGGLLGPATSASLRPDLAVGVPAAQFEVGLDGEPTAAFGELVPQSAVLHHAT